MAQPRRTPRQRRARLRYRPGGPAAGGRPCGHLGAGAVRARLRDLHPALRGGGGGGRRPVGTAGGGRHSSGIEDITRLIHYSSYWRNGPVLNNALSGVDQALWDIAGKRAGLPVYELLGGRSRSAVEVYSHAAARRSRRRSIGPRNSSRPGTGTQAAGRRSGTGTTARPPPGAATRGPRTPMAGTCSTTSRRRPSFSRPPASASAPRSASCTMCTACWTPKQAIVLARALEPYRLSFLEDVIAPEHYDRLPEVRAASPVPIAVESRSDRSRTRYG